MVGNLNMPNKLIAFLGFLILFSSCDCNTVVKGRILSFSSRRPINGAKIEMIGKNVISNSDSNGFFRVRKFTGFCFSPKIKVTFDNYKPFEIELESESEYQNYKVNKESEFVDFENPVKSSDYHIEGTWIEKYSSNFEVKSDSLIIYLDEDNLKKELDLIQNHLKQNR